MVDESQTRSELLKVKRNQILLVFLLCTRDIYTSVAMAITDIFRNNGISVGRNLAKILKIFEKIDEAKDRGVI
jgi:hypothetical protein